METIVLFHGCKYLVPIWKGEEWQFHCSLPDGQFDICPKTIKKRKPSKECFTEEYTMGWRG